MKVTGLDQTPNDRLRDLLRRMPKAELHVHIEGTLEPELILSLARRNGIDFPYSTVEELQRAYEFPDLQSFLDIYYAATSVLLLENDFYEMGMAYFARCANDNVVRTEVFFDPQTHTTRGVPFKTVIDGLSRAAQAAHRAWGISAVFILCFLRHMSEAEAMATLEGARPYLDRIAGFGLDSSEVGNPPSKFARVFAACRQTGLPVVAHAGEEGPASYVREALDLLGASWIDHGVRCMEDPELVGRLARDHVPLTVCPLSNVRLKVFPSMGQHNLAALLAAGLRVTINSDDPAYFGGYMNDNFLAVFDALPQLHAGHAHQLALNSIEGSFASSGQKQQWREELDHVFASEAP